jgi:putative hydrolase of the HAD superfamily
VSELRAVISDFGGVLTTPLMAAFAGVHERMGVPMEALGRAMQCLAERDGSYPLFELEKGRMTEADFLRDIGAFVSEDLGRDVQMHSFREVYFEGLQPNEAMIEQMRGLRDRGLRMALLTNNIREWEPHWRGMLPVDEIFELVVDSAFVGMRKPEPEIYELTCERLGVPPAECLFVDDVEVNCQAAEALGMTAVWYREPEQAIAEIDAALGTPSP